MILDFLKSVQNITLVVHKNPDADSIGSASAFYSYLLRENKNISYYCISPKIAHNLSFIPWSDKIKDRLPKDIDCIISFDCGSIERLGFDTDGVTLINFDHHRSNNNFGKFNIVNPDAISTTEVVYDFFVANDIKINAKMATSLYAGLVDDSDSFKSRDCTIKTFAMAQSLLESGAEHAMAITNLYHKKSLSYIRLKSIMLGAMELIADARVAIFDIDRESFNRSGAFIADAKAICEEALSLSMVEVVVLFAESVDDVVVSIRSSSRIDANVVASAFGGGGHSSRAGARVSTADKQKIIDEIKKGLS